VRSARGVARPTDDASSTVVATRSNTSAHTPQPYVSLRGGETWKPS
jgi:hypothetical protein